jgi:hypothetical protein
VKENLVDIDGKFHDRTSFNSFVKLNNKTYLFAREVFKEEEKEGITALEFDPTKLDFVGSPKNIFKSSDRVRSNYNLNSLGYGGFTFGWEGSMSMYDLKLSQDHSKFMYSYSLVPKERKDSKSYEIVGLQVFDENLNKVWGGEYELPYTEAKMDNLGFILKDDGQALLLARVYDGDNAKEGRSKDEPNYHFEVLTFGKGINRPKTSKIVLDNYFPTAATLYETPKHEIAITGFYAKTLNGPVDGAYNVRMDTDKGTFSRIQGGYYEIPQDVMMQYTSKRERKKVEKQEKKAEKRDQEFDLGIRDLEINSINLMPDGSTKIISEIYYVRITTYYDASCKCTKTRYDTYAEDIYVMSITAGGKLDWVRKIPKAQHAADKVGRQLSIQSIIKDNELHIFYVDNLKNFNLPVTEAPKRHESRKGGFLNGVTVTADGTIKKYNLGEIEDYKTPFFIREFANGENYNLLSTERRKKKNVLYSIEVH